MFKKLITACAGLVLSSGMALAVDVSGVYTGQNVSVALSSQGGMVRGQVSVNGQTLPLVGQEANGQIQGIWRDPSGQDVPFAAAVGANGLQLQTNGVVYSLGRNTAAQTSPQPQPEQFVPQQQQEVPANNAPGNLPAGQVQFETRQGRVMQCEVPAGWQFSDTANGVDTAAPDGITMMSHTFVRGMGRCTPDAYLQHNMQSWPQYGIANAQLLSKKDTGQGIAYEFQYTVHGKPAHCLMQISVNQGPGGYMAEMVFLQSAPETFQQYLPVLIQMAKSVRVTDGTAFCDTGIWNHEAEKRRQIVAQTQAEIGQIRNQMYTDYSRNQAQSFLQNSDTRRDLTRFDDGTGQVTGPLQAQRMFRMSDGTYTYSTNTYDPVPQGATELNPHVYHP